MEVIKRESQRKRGGGGRIASGVAQQKDIMMKRDTHKGEQEHVPRAECEHSVKAQQEDPENGEHPGDDREGERDETETQLGLFFHLCHDEAVKIIHTLSSHTQSYSRRDRCAAGDAGKTRRDHLKSRDGG